MRKNNLKITLAFVVAILLGLVLQFVNPTMAFLTIILLLLLAVFSLAILIIGLFSKKFRIWYIIGLVPIIVAFVFTGAVRNYKHKKALELKQQLELFKTQNGKYPTDLKQLNIKLEIEGLSYSRNSDTTYELEYLMDKFNREHFNSASGKWTTLGWND